MPRRPWETLAACRADLDWAKLDSYVEELERWNRAIRLVGPKDIMGIRLQVEDALLPFLLCTPRFPLLDIGSGAGLPGIPLAIALAAELAGTDAPGLVCLEPLGKRVSFLRHAVRHLGLRNVDVVGERAEEGFLALPALAGRFRTVTARAVADAAEVLPLTEPYLAPDGQVFLPRGDEAPVHPGGWNLVTVLSYEGPPGVGRRCLHVYERAP